MRWFILLTLALVGCDASPDGNLTLIDRADRSEWKGEARTYSGGLGSAKVTLRDAIYEGGLNIAYSGARYSDASNIPTGRGELTVKSTNGHEIKCKFTYSEGTYIGFGICTDEKGGIYDLKLDLKNAG